MGMFECSAVGCSDEVPGEGNELTVVVEYETDLEGCLLYTSPSPRD